MKTKIEQIEKEAKSYYFSHAYDIKRLGRQIKDSTQDGTEAMFAQAFLSKSNKIVTSMLASRLSEFMSQSEAIIRLQIIQVEMYNKAKNLFNEKYKH
jgi:hypothetical protein